MSQKSKHILCHHLIGFFDVLGQSNQLRQLTKLPETDDERAETIQLLKRTAGVVLGVRGMFKDFFEAVCTPTPFALSLPPAPRRQLLDATQAEVSYRGVSDSFIVAVSLADTGMPTTPVNGVFRSFVAASGMWLLSLSVGHPLRGGIEVGLGMDVGDGEVYGPVLDRAYHLESKVAGGPRLVVGDTCVDYLNFMRKRQTADVYQQIAAKAADFCLSMLMRDQDGTVVLDPLGERMLEIARTTGWSRGRSGTRGIIDRVKPAHDVVRQQLMRAELLKDEKLIPRYRNLLAYFDHRAALWT